MKRDIAALKRAEHNCAAELNYIRQDIAALEASREREAREQARVSAVARTKFFRDGTPKSHPKHREVARHYAWYVYKTGKSLPRPAKGQTGRSKAITLFRMAELERLISFRHGKVLPNDGEGRHLLEIVGHHIAYLGRDAERHIVSWAGVWAPWMHESEAASIAQSIIARPLKFKADTLGWRLRLSSFERADLSITTIGAFDVSKAERELRRKERRAEANRRRRQKKGAIPRLQYLARSITLMKPWAVVGMSRATWYRRGAPMPSKQDRQRWENSREDHDFEDVEQYQADDESREDDREDRELAGGFSGSNAVSETSARPAGDSDYAVHGVVSARAPAGAAARPYAPAAHLVAQGARCVLGRGSNRVSGTTHSPPVHIEKRQTSRSQPEIDLSARHQRDRIKVDAEYRERWRAWQRSYRKRKAATRDDPSLRGNSPK
jgi:hypothetical protein